MSDPKAKPKLIEEAYKLLTEEQWLSRESRHLQRIEDVKICLSFIKDSIRDYKQLLAQQNEDETWRRYITCDGIPIVDSPPEVRKFVDEIHHVEQQNVENTVNWDLSVDERSILAQDTEMVDLTRRMLLRTSRPNIGQFYDESIQRILVTLHRIEIMLNNEQEMLSLRSEQTIEIFSLRAELNRAIDMLFDKLTYRIIVSPDTYKTDEEGYKQSYSYTSKNYHLQIWWLSDVPIRFKYLDLPQITAVLDCVGVRVQIPCAVLKDNLTLRCIHTFFDSYSEFAKSYDLFVEKSLGEFNAGMIDIEDCLVNEWMLQISIMNNIINKLDQEYMLYRENLREAELKLSKKSEQTVILPKEPYILPEGMYPDPYDVFLEQEQSEYLEFLEQQLSPIKLDLHPDEINLRKYCILGGIYSMTFVHKPKQTVFSMFNRTFHEEKRVLHTMEEICAVDKDSEKEEVSQMRNTIRNTYSRLQPINARLSGDNLDYFVVTIKLPKFLCRYGEPVACQFYDEIIEEHQEESQTDAEDSDRKFKRKRNTYSRAHSRSHSQRPSEIKPRSSSLSRKTSHHLHNAGNVERQSSLSRLRNTSISRRDFIPSNLYSNSQLSILRYSAFRTSIKPGVRLKNFQLNDDPLTIEQLCDIKKFCLPRMLSSFKFPLEFRAEKYEEFLAKQTRGKKIIERPLTQGDGYEEEPEPFNYVKQSAPERLFPIFDRREKVLYDEGDESSETSSESATDCQFKVVKIDQIPSVSTGNQTTMYAVLSKLDEINEKYKTRPEIIYRQHDKQYKRKSPTTFADLPEGFDGTRKLHRIRGSPELSQRSRPSKISVDSQLYSTQNPSRETLATHTSSATLVSDSNTYKKGKSSKTLEEKPKPVRSSVRVTHWTTKHLIETIFNREELTMTIKTDRLGLFGFACKRYEHFPFRDWKLQQNPDNANEIIFMVDTNYVRVYLFITPAGIRGFVTKITNEYVARMEKYMEIEEPISDYRELRQRFCEANVNIFSENDACYYIENGYFCVKHISMELHVYDAFAIHCKLFRFYRSDWNRLATRRNIVLCLGNANAKDSNDVTVRVTPDNSTFVEVSEPCTLDLDNITLAYKLTWRNMGTYSDLHQLINSMNPQATDLRNRDPKLIYYIRTLLSEVRPLSYS